MTKLTLSVDQKVVQRAKRFAAERGISVSRMVQNYLDAIVRLGGDKPEDEEDLPPVTRRLWGVLKGVRYDRKSYFDYLEQKYRWGGRKQRRRTKTRVSKRVS